MGYYRRVNGSLATVRGYGHLVRASANARRAGLLVTAAELDAILAQMYRDMGTLSLRSAMKADTFIKDRIKLTRTGRPARPAGHSGDLPGHVFSRPLATTLPIGSFGIADVDELDKVINPGTPSYGTYWRAQEYGFDRGAASSKPVPGYFMPGFSAPAAAQSRVHPYFEQMQYAKGMPALVVIKPIKARHFLRDGADAAIAWHVSQRSKIHNTAITRMRAI